MPAFRSNRDFGFHSIPRVCGSEEVFENIRCTQSNPIQCDMTGAGRSSSPASQTTIYYIQTGRRPNLGIHGYEYINYCCGLSVCQRAAHAMRPSFVVTTEHASTSDCNVTIMLTALTALMKRTALQVSETEIEQGLTSHQTHYRSYRGRFLQVIRPNRQCQSTEGN